MSGRTSFAIVVAVAALLVAAPAAADSWGADRRDEGALIRMLDAREHSFEVKQVANSAPDGFERFAAAHSLREPVVDDRFRIDPTADAPVAVASAREFQWPQIGIGIVLLVALGIAAYLVARFRQRPLAH